MAIPALSVLENTAKEIVYTAIRDGTLSGLTIRKVRDRLEEIHSLDEGTLLASDYKSAIKVFIQHASTEAKDEAKSEEFRIQPERTVIQKEIDKTEDTTSLLAVKKRQSASGKTFKSAEFIQSSDSEEPYERKPEILSPKRLPKQDVIKRKQSKPAIKPSPQKRRKIVQSDNESDTEVETKETASSMIVKEGLVEDDNMASLFGDSPKKSKKARASGDDKVTTKKVTSNKSKTSTSTRKPSSQTSDSHDAMIKKLKSFVTACGVRKPWAKIFKDIQKPTQQIQKLKEILGDLGMSGRMSLEKAKRIRAERELAQELEDVRSFEKSVLNRSRSRTASTSRASIKPAESEEESEEDIKPTRRKISASRMAIDAFLESESGED